MSRNLRSALSVIMFCLLTLVDGLVALLLGGLLSLLFWGRPDHPLGWLPYTWAKQLKRHCLDPVGLRWTYDDCADFRSIPGLKIVICNHPPTLLTPAVSYITGQYVSERMAMVFKASHLFNLMGLGMLGLRAGIYVSRLYQVWPICHWSWPRKKFRNFSSWWYRWQVRRLVKRAANIDGGIAIIVLPDQRFTPQRRTAYLAAYREKIFGLANWSITLPPRSGALLELLRACNGLGVTVVDMTIVLKEPDAEGWTNFEPYYDSEVMVRVKDVTNEVMLIALEGGDQARFQDWLNNLFRRKNIVGARWRREKRDRSD